MERFVLVREWEDAVLLSHGPVRVPDVGHGPTVLAVAPAPPDAQVDEQRQEEDQSPHDVDEQLR